MADQQFFNFQLKYTSNVHSMEYNKHNFIHILQPLNYQRNSLIESVTAKMFVSRLDEKKH